MPKPGTIKDDCKRESLKRNNSNSSPCSIADIKSAVRTKAQKRKHSEALSSSDKELESEFEDCDLEDAKAIEKKIRHIARNNSLSDGEMRRLLKKFVKNEHVLALVSLKAEDEVAREKRAAEKRAIIIADTPSVPKLTRARARELNRTPVIALPSLSDTNPPDIASLIKDDLHSDEDDEEYTFQEEDFHSDDDQNITVSDFDSNPSTPLVKTEESPLKLSEDGCFKIPLAKEEDLRIATRTRSKYCLEKTTIEDLQSEFIPPDVEFGDLNDATEFTTNDEDWMEFLNDFSKPLIDNNFTVDDDDPVNDPEYIADPPEKIKVDSEELRDVNISRKELSDLVAELFEGLINEGVSLESIELETPQKFVNANAGTDSQQNVASPSGKDGKTSQALDAVTRQIDFDNEFDCKNGENGLKNIVSDDTISSTNNINHNECSFLPSVVSTPATTIVQPETRQISPISTLPHQQAAGDEFIAIPVPGKPSVYQLAKVVPSENLVKPPQQLADTRYTTPYDTNYTWQYISIKKHVYSEYNKKYQNITETSITLASGDRWSYDCTGFSQHQHDLLQQQLRIHVQFLTQHYIQTYSHPDLWRYAKEPRKLLMDIKELSESNATLKAWNLDAAVQTVLQWEEDCAVDNEENREMMQFLNNEVYKTKRNTRQVARFAPRIMECLLKSTVCIYPEYLPRIPFVLQKNKKFDVFAPSESELIALGLEKHMKYGRIIHDKPVSMLRASERISKDMICGKTRRRIYDRIHLLRTAVFDNPVKYFFEFGFSPPIDCKLLSFSPNEFFPLSEKLSELPMAWQKYLKQKEARKATEIFPIVASERANSSYERCVREAVADIEIPDSNLETHLQGEESKKEAEGNEQEENNNSSKTQPVIVNINYIFGTDAKSIALNKSNNSSNSLIQSVSDANLYKNNTENLEIGNIFPLSAFQVTSPTKVAIDQQPIVLNYDPGSSSFVPFEASLNHSSQVVNDSQQRKITDYFSIKRIDDSRSCEHVKSNVECDKSTNSRKIKRSLTKKRRRLKTALEISRRRHSITLKHRKVRHRRKKTKFALLVRKYKLCLKAQIEKFKSQPIVKYFFKQFKALDLYTELLIDLKTNCKSMATHGNVTAGGGEGVPIVSQASSSGLGKRARNNATHNQDEEEPSSVRTKKVNRQEENCRNMLLPESAEESNRKDATYALNFYEKVEELFKASSRSEDYKQFTFLLQNFDPKNDKVSELYYKLERLFLPDFPELAEIFLTFLLPSEAAEIGKFFDHFMATNMSTFINKLNIYFHKQPAQIRKVYNCLNELAGEKDISMKKIEDKILPLLKGNEFLIDWFMQIFPTVPPPERLFATSEKVNLKTAHNNQNGEHLETILDILDSPTQEQQEPHCQLRYINGGIFYGSKITLPAKLSFMAQKYVDEEETEQQILCSEASDNNINRSCIHAIREHGEKRLMSSSLDCNGSDDNDKSEEDDNSKTLIIDTTVDDESDDAICDDATLHAHAVRLNPHYYGSASYNSANSSSTSGTGTQSAGHNQNSTQQHHHSNSKRGSFNANSALHNGKATSSACGGAGAIIGHNVNNVTNATILGATANTTLTSAPQREKRKSPTKKSIATSSMMASASSTPKSSPTNRTRIYNTQPMVVIHEHSSAIASAKKLKSLVEYSSESDTDAKAGITIVAQAKYSKKASEASPEPAPTPSCTKTALFSELKAENMPEEFIPEHAKVSIDLNSEVHDQSANIGRDSKANETLVVACDNDSSPCVTDNKKDTKCKIVGTSNAKAKKTSTSETNITNRNAEEVKECSSTLSSPATAWTRDEDKVILTEMKLDSRNREDLFQRIGTKLLNRSIDEISERHQFLLDFLSKLQRT